MIIGNPIKVETFIDNGGEKSFFKDIEFLGLIWHKKNLAAKIAIYDKLCISHDYIEILKGWRIGFIKFKDNWEICQNIILDNNGKRDREWLLWDHPSLVKNNNGKSPYIIPYGYNSSYMFISGTYFFVKKTFFWTTP